MNLTTLVMYEVESISLVTSTTEIARQLFVVVDDGLIHRSFEAGSGDNFTVQMRYIPCLARWVYFEDWATDTRSPNCLLCLGYIGE